MKVSSRVTYVLLLVCCAAAVLADPVNKGFSILDDQPDSKCVKYNQTYSNGVCTIVKDCNGEHILERHRGLCKERADSQPCLVSLSYAMKMKVSDSSTFIPKCRDDGSYAPVQCRRDTGCWCVTPQGKPLPNTSVRNGRPKCKTERSNSKKCSPSKGRRNHKGCSRSDRNQFNLNFTNILWLDYARDNQMPLLQEKDTNKLIEWKFNLLDTNKNDILDKSEYFQFKGIIKKVVKPKRCARLFIEACDVNNDELITKQEWINCITDNSNYLLQVGRTIENSPGYGDDSLDRNKDDGDSNDCLYDRKTALDNQKNGDTVLYVPECTADGRFKRTQCYPNTGYCWCVIEDTGKPIPGTSVKEKSPDCDSLSIPNRPMKGCPEHKKSIFLKDLMEHLRHEMILNTNISEIAGSVNSSKWLVSEEEKIALWSFVMWDKNKNGKMEKKEWKAFRSFVKGNHLLEQCGKRLPKYCDVNNDQKINTTEWINCLNAKRKTSNIETTSMKSTTISRRKGPNPLESVLKGE